MSQRPPKVLVIAPCAFPFSRGTPIRIARLARLMGARFPLAVATFHQSDAADFPVPISRIPRLPVDVTARSGPSFAKIVCDAFLLLLVLYKVIFEGYRVLDGHLHEGALIALAGRFLGARAIYNAHGTLAKELVYMGWVKEGSRSARWVAALEHWIEAHMDAVVAQSEMRAAELVRNGVDPRRVHVVEDVPVFETYPTLPPGELARRFMSGGERVVIYTGELLPYQGVDLLLEAFPRVLDSVPSARLILFGNPPEPCRTTIADLACRERIHLINDVPFARIGDWLALADVAVVPRLYGENVPGKLPIYMCAGKAIVGTDLPGINTVLRHEENGLLVPPEAGRLAGAIVRLLRDDALRGRLAKAALEEARRRYSSEKIETTLGGGYETLGRGRA